MTTWRRRRPAVGTPRAVLSVGFAVADFAAVDRAAEALGVPTSVFVRDAALARAASVARGDERKEE